MIISCRAKSNTPKRVQSMLRTYLANAEGGADYLVEEQIVADPENIAVNIPESGTLAPTGEYYVTSFLMTEKEQILMVTA